MTKDKPTYTAKVIAQMVGVNYFTVLRQLGDGRYGFLPEMSGNVFKLTYNQALTILRIHKLTKMFTCTIDGAVFMNRLMEENMALKKELAKCRKEN